VTAALALLVFSVNWAGFLIIIAALPALYECGLRRLRPLVTVVPTQRARPLGPELAGRWAFGCRPGWRLSGAVAVLLCCAVRRISSPVTSIVTATPAEERSRGSR